MSQRSLHPSVSRTALPSSRQVLLLIDFINPLDFEGSEALEPAALAAAQATRALKRRLARQGVACIYANDNYGVWRSNFDGIRRLCRERGGVARRLATLLAPSRADFTLLKPRHSAFYCTPLPLLLAQMKTRRLVLTGLAADNCVLFTAMDAYVRGFELWIPSDCVAAESERAKQESLDYAVRVLKARTHASA
jgi:nicotinamidase-related amidase